MILWQTCLEYPAVNPKPSPTKSKTPSEEQKKSIFQFCWDLPYIVELHITCWWLAYLDHQIILPEAREPLQLKEA